MHNLFSHKFGSISLIILYLITVFVPCSFFRDSNDKGRQKPYYGETAVTVQSNQADVYSNDHGQASGHGRPPRTAVADLPLVNNLNGQASRHGRPPRTAVADLPLVNNLNGQASGHGRLPRTAMADLPLVNNLNGQVSEHERPPRTAHGRLPRTAVADLPLVNNLNLMVDRALEKEHHSFTKPFGSFIELDCDTDATKAIFKQYARASRQWVHNNNALEIENDRMVYQMGFLTIQALKAADQGVFICRIEYEPKQFKSVALFTLVVESSESKVRVQETGVLALQSNSAPLGYMFPAATRAWWLNDKTIRSNISASQTSEDRFLHANKNFLGIWTCVVSHQLKDGTNRTWKTARYVVQLTPPPSKLEKLLAYCSSHPTYIVMCVVLLCGFILVVFIGLVYRVDQDKMVAQTEMGAMKERLLAGKPSGKDNTHSNVDHSHNAYQASHGYDEQEYYLHENEHDYNNTHQNQKGYNKTRSK